MELTDIIQEFESAQAALSDAIFADDLTSIKQNDAIVTECFQSLLDFVPESVDSAVKLTKVLLNSIPGTDETSEVTKAVQGKLVEIVEMAGSFPDG